MSVMMGLRKLQDLVEMDHEYDLNIDADAHRQVISDGKPAQVRSFAEVLASSAEQ